MHQILFEWYEFAFKSVSNGSNLHSNALNPFQVVRICIRMLRIPFKWLEFAFERFEPLSNGSNLHSNALNPVRKIRICIQWFEWFESLSNGLKLHSNASNAFLMVRICIRTLRIPFKWLEFVIERFETFSNGSNLH